jgi:rhamnose utilization protein RhaD (predicted bifunctional aldolase and dehydrogenase)
VIAGGGNTSFKDEERIWIKASGIPLAGIQKNGFVCLSREKLAVVNTASYSQDPVEREEEVKADVAAAILSPENLRPSVETSLHNLIDYKFIVHTHPTLVNGLLCSLKAGEEVQARFGDMALFVEYTDPGYILFKKLQEMIGEYTLHHGKPPQIIFLQNHGVFVGADTTETINELYEDINQRIGEGKDLSLPDATLTEYSSEITEVLSEYYAGKGLRTRATSSDLIRHFTRDMDHYLKVNKPFSPDIIVYCKSRYLFIGSGATPEILYSACHQFEETYGYQPRVILEEGGGLIAVEENEASLNTVTEIFVDLMKISKLSEQFGGPHFMTPEQIHFIDHWEVENYRRQVAKRRG